MTSLRKISRCSRYMFYIEATSWGTSHIPCKALHMLQQAFIPIHKRQT